MADLNVKYTKTLADKVSDKMGSWLFINIQAAVFVFWILWNTQAPQGLRWDPYPFILLNLFMSAEAAFTAPALMMSANAAAARDRNTINQDLKLDVESFEILKSIKRKLDEKD